jgi:hypothetical protein
MKGTDDDEILAKKPEMSRKTIILFGLGIVLATGILIGVGVYIKGTETSVSDECAHVDSVRLKETPMQNAAPKKSTVFTFLVRDDYCDFELEDAAGMPGLRQGQNVRVRAVHAPDKCKVTDVFGPCPQN